MCANVAFTKSLRVSFRFSHSEFTNACPLLTLADRDTMIKGNENEIVLNISVIFLLTTRYSAFNTHRTSRSLKSTDVEPSVHRRKPPPLSAHSSSSVAFQPLHVHVLRRRHFTVLTALATRLIYVCMRSRTFNERLHRIGIYLI